MLTVAEALDVIRRNVTPLPARLELAREIVGQRLAKDIVSRNDSPPFDKSMVDGFAIDVADRAPTLRITELVTAGIVPKRRIEPGTTIRVMTGAPIPEGADAVVKWEDCEQLDDETIRNPAGVVASGSCVIRRGASFHAGEAVLTAGQRMGPLQLALLAEVGEWRVPIFPRPRVGVLATGDELVAANEDVGPGQIRNSNGPMLEAAIAAMGAKPLYLGVVRDDPDKLRARISLGFRCDVLLVSGGVSAGVKDLVPGIFAELGVVEQFHQVRVKPGKPLWFGVYRIGDQRTLVFGLPGNPVSTLVSFKVFVEPALAALAGAAFAPPAVQRSVLATTFTHRGKRPTYHPCKTVREEADTGRRVVEPLDWKGSADLATLARADCLGAFPEGDYELAVGAAIDVLML